ncbi:MAG TPA: DUF2723 domain-containing protein, partial [Chloroflexota bacterium]|nr:DUF2723 domain-containing protein [Chloroflexota bacterium]
MTSADHPSFEIRRRLPRSDAAPVSSIGFALAVAGAAGIPYLMTIAPTISWRNGGIDSGELVTAMYVLGIPHPTGFPLYMILGRLFIFLPIGEVAFRANLLSTVCAAGTVGLIVLSGISINRRHSSASWPVILAGSATGGLAFAFSPLFWARATIAKEYTLNSLLLAAGLMLLLDWRTGRQPSRLVAFAGMVGLGMADHITSLSLLPGALVFILLVDPRSAIRGSVVLRSILVLLLGLSLYAYIPIRAAAVPYVDWGNPTTLSTFYDHVSGATYKDILANALKPPDIAQRLLFGVRGIPDQLGWPGLVAFLIGVWVMAQRDRPVLALLGFTGSINLLFASMYPVRDSEAYLLPFYLTGAVIASVGFCQIYRKFMQVIGTRGRYPIWVRLTLLIA